MSNLENYLTSLSNKLLFICKSHLVICLKLVDVYELCETNVVYSIHHLQSMGYLLYLVRAG